MVVPGEMVPEPLASSGEPLTSPPSGNFFLLQFLPTASLLIEEELRTLHFL